MATGSSGSDDGMPTKEFDIPYPEGAQMAGSYASEGGMSYKSFSELDLGAGSDDGLDPFGSSSDDGSCGFASDHTRGGIPIGRHRRSRAGSSGAGSRVEDASQRAPSNVLRMPSAAMAFGDEHRSCFRRHKRFVVLAAGVCIEIALGTLYSWGNATSYITSFLHNEEPSVDFDTTLYIYTTTLVVFSLTLAASGFFLARFGNRVMAMVGGLIMSTGVALTAFAPSFLWALLTYGVMVGLGTGAAYIAPLACAVMWFPNNKGLVNGVIVMGFGLGASACNQFMTAWANPLNLPFDSSGDHDGFFPAVVFDRVPSMLRICGVTYFAMTVLPGLLLSDPPPSPYDVKAVPGRAPLGANTNATSGYVVLEPVGEISRMDAVKKPLFWALWFALLCSTAAGLNVIGSYKKFGERFIDDDSFLALVGSVASVFNGLGRVVYGYLTDKLKYRRAIALMAVTQTVLMMTYHFTASNNFFYMAWTSLIFFNYGACFSIFPTAVAEEFGVLSFANIYGLILTAFGVSSVSGTMFVASDFGSSLDPSAIFMVMGVVTAVAAVIAVALEVRAIRQLRAGSVDAGANESGDASNERRPLISK